MGGLHQGQAAPFDACHLPRPPVHFGGLDMMQEFLAGSASFKVSNICIPDLHCVPQASRITSNTRTIALKSTMATPVDLMPTTISGRHARAGDLALLLPKYGPQDGWASQHIKYYDYLPMCMLSSAPRSQASPLSEGEPDPRYGCSSTRGMFKYWGKRLKVVRPHRVSYHGSS